MRKLATVFLSVLLLLSIAAIAKSRRPMTPEDLYRIKSVSDPRVSPDGKWIAYTVSVPDLKANSFNSDIWIIPLTGGEPAQLTTSPKADRSPRWSPDGERIAFVSSRDGTSNIYVINISGGEARKITSSETALYSPLWSRDGKYIICGSRILPEGKKHSENWTKDELPECEARTIDRLLFRQWDRWLGDKRNHVFLVNVEDGSMKDISRRFRYPSCIPGEFPRFRHLA